MTIGSVSERPDLFQLPKLWFVQVSPHFRRSQSGMPLRMSALPAEIVAFAVAGVRPSSASLPSDELTYAVSVSTLGVRTVQPTMLGGGAGGVTGGGLPPPPPPPPLDPQADQQTEKARIPIAMRSGASHRFRKLDMHHRPFLTGRLPIFHAFEWYAARGGEASIFSLEPSMNN